MSATSSHNMLIVIAGPTAVGKTAVAIQLALRFGAQIVSADSRQFFRELNIGTAKPSSEELNIIQHHFINSHSIVEEYDAARFGVDALARINELFRTHSRVVLCGGSGLYIKALIEGFDDIPGIDPGIRESLVKEFDRHGISWLQERMKAEDPDYYETLDKQNPHRLIRALEVKIGTGQSLGSFHKKETRVHDFEVVKVGLELPRESLYQRIDYRMDEMVAAGLFDEATSVYSFRNHQALQTVGYQEIFDYLDGKYDREEAIRLLKRNSRRYAKRQLTWFKRDVEMKWFHPDEIDNIAAWILRSEKKTR